MDHIRSLVGIVSLAALALVAVSCGDDGGGGDTGVTPRFVVATHGDAEFVNDVVYCPGELGFSVLLEALGTGWVSLEHEAFGAEVVEVTWEKQNDTYVVSAPRVRVSALFQEDPYYFVQVGWENLSLVAHDDDGNGTAEVGEATATLICDWEEVLFPDTELYDATFDLDAEVEPAVVAFAGSVGLEPIYTFADAMTVTSSKPLLTETLAGNVQLLADGTPIAATVTPRDETWPFANGFRIDPEEPVPFDTDLTLGIGAVTDGFGRAIEFDGVPRHTVADPGPLTFNPSFEGDGGWIGLHKALASGDFPAIDGPTLAAIFYQYPQGDELIGYFDVPLDAVEFSIQVGLAGYSNVCNYSTSSVWLETPAGSRGLFPDIPDDPACDDYPYGCVVPWSKRTVSLLDLRGQRVILRASPATYSECRPDVYDDLYLDDVRIE